MLNGLFIELCIVVFFARNVVIVSPNLPKLHPLDVVVMVDQSHSLFKHHAEFSDKFKTFMKGIFDMDTAKTHMSFYYCGSKRRSELDNIQPFTVKTEAEFDKEVDESKKREKPTLSNNKENLLLCAKGVNKLYFHGEPDDRKNAANVLVFFGDSIHDMGPYEEEFASIRERSIAFYFRLKPPEDTWKRREDRYKKIIIVIIGEYRRMIDMEDKPDFDGIITKIKKEICGDPSSSATTKGACDFSSGSCMITYDSKNNQYDICGNTPKPCNGELVRCCDEKFPYDKSIGDCSCTTGTKKLQRKSQPPPTAGCPPSDKDIACDKPPTCITTTTKKLVKPSGPKPTTSKQTDKPEEPKPTEPEPEPTDVVKGRKRVTEAEDSRLPMWIGIAVAAAILLLLVLMIILVVVFRRRKKKASRKVKIVVVKEGAKKGKEKDATKEKKHEGKKQHGRGLHAAGMGDKDRGVGVNLQKKAETKKHPGRGLHAKGKEKERGVRADLHTDFRHGKKTSKPAHTR